MKRRREISNEAAASEEEAPAQQQRRVGLRHHHEQECERGHVLGRGRSFALIARSRLLTQKQNQCGGGDFSNKRCCEWNGMLVQVQQQMRSREVCSALQSLQRMLSTITGAVCPQPMQMAMFWHVTGKVFESAGSLERAVAVFSNVLVHYPVFPHTNDVHFRLGRILRRQSKPLLALRHFEQALCDLPLGVTRDDVMFEIAQTHEANHSFQQAQRAYLAIQPPTAMSLVRLAHLYTRHPSLQTQSQGMWLLKATLNTFPKCADGWLILSRVLALQGQPTEAYAALANAMLLEPSSPLLWCETGALYLDHAQYADAFKALERSYQLHSQVPETLCNLGLLYEIGGEHRQARDKYEEAQRISSDPAIAQRISRVTQALAASHNNNNSGNNNNNNISSNTLSIHSQPNCFSGVVCEVLQCMRANLNNPLGFVRDTPLCLLTVPRHMPDLQSLTHCE